MNNVSSTPPTPFINPEKKARVSKEKPRIKVMDIFPKPANDQVKTRLSADTMHVRQATGHPKQHPIIKED